MSQTELRRRMRGSDAMFLYFERKEMPLHIGFVAVLDGSFDSEAEQLLAARLPEMPRYRQRVIFSPMNISHPTWEDDPDFRIENHVRRIHLDPPGTERQLSEIAGRVFTELMDRNRPLWDLTLVDGLEGGKSALILRVHHCMVDGISGIALTNVLFDTSRTPRRPEPRPWHPSPLPAPQESLVDGLASVWADAAERVVGAQLTMLRLAGAFIGQDASGSRRALLATIPELLWPTEKLPFNGPCSGVRGHCWTRAVFADARAVRSALGGTINDVVLSTVTGAVMRYVSAHREALDNRFVRVMVPVNLRAEDPHGTAGNEISMIPLSIPLDIFDPEQRFKEIARRMAIMKAAHVADIVQLIGTGIGWIPAALQPSIAALPFMPQPVPIVNLVCTNVPGPMVPLYANGRELLTYWPHVPCGSDVGIGVAISSYNKHLFYGVTYDMQAAPDGELFRDFLDESWAELRDAAGIRTMAEPASAHAHASASEAVAPLVHVNGDHPAPVTEAPQQEPVPVVQAIPSPAIPRSARVALPTRPPARKRADRKSVGEKQPKRVHAKEPAAKIEPKESTRARKPRPKRAGAAAGSK